MLKNYYQVLGIDQQASQEEIKKAYRSQAKQYHPDAVGADPRREDIFKEINEAYQVLGDREKRRSYDIMCSPSRNNGIIYPGEDGDALADLIRAMFEVNPHMRGMACRGRGLGRRGCRRKI